jgi:hypothetical protein
MQNKETQYYRTMDLIQLNICKNHNENFRMSECIDWVSVEAEYQSKLLFTSFPFVKKLAGSGGGAYKITTVEEYGY